MAAVPSNLLFGNDLAVFIIFKSEKLEMEWEGSMQYLDINPIYVLILKCFETSRT